MDLAIRVNVRYAAPPNSHIKDALRLFKSPRWVQSIIRYIMPQLNSVSPASTACVEALKHNMVPVACGEACVVCMESFDSEWCVELPCRHKFHMTCIDPWLKLHSTCPTCRHQLPTDAFSNYSVYAINTTIILQQSQASMPTAQLLELPASNQVIRAVVNARVRRNPPAAISDDMCCSQVSTMPPVMNARIMQQHNVNDLEPFEPLDNQLEECLPSPRTSRQSPLTRRRCREANTSNKRARLDSSQHEIASSV
ncbi:unnamed protein product [Aphanomyces euteiches]|uniref:RING-type domain-containing protein n=1 Tax=Aphanomyces euteiches TaxID=100861 RepID=A0A6G0WX73_9STRA|nr:hypothetical protein Ae201684_010825 [Aphanomyces euteiches]KAH9061554.1 hypothetical protein Ae201684P_020889 [Aphanomyces euteiches]KAH9127705.1 hypothetical protein AeMF1_002021 [Aphanomyces euteiches]KAH9133868.1 hypothetical protein LEN26_006957 [Aphanomyces euteiches]KAH9145720.1 hypothetical protein AeRB84_010374 [Aphanomyces euteiches]